MATTSAPLTELEAVTLGAVADGPQTAYELRLAFQRSPSARFSGSAGAIYPLLKRLEERALVASRAAATGRRPAREYRITRTGRTALRAWIRAPLDARAAAVHDPLRTRMLFLDQLTPTERRAWLADAEEAIRSQAELIEEYAERLDDTPAHHFANDNARTLNRARLRWLVRVRERWGTRAPVR